MISYPQNTLASTATFLVILRKFFQYSIPQMPFWAWDPDPLKTRIKIEMAYNIRLQEVQQRPAISVQRGPFSTRRSTFGDVAAHEFPGSSLKNVYSKEIHGTMGVNVYSLEGGEAEAIANLIFELFITQEQILEREFKFKWLGDVSIGQMALMEDDRSVHVVPLSISPVVYDMGWTTSQTDSPMLKALHLESIDETLKASVYKEYFPSTEV